MIEVEARIVGKLGERAYRAALPNGKIVVAHPSRSVESTGVELEEGDIVRLEMSPYDFSRGRIADLPAGG